MADKPVNSLSASLHRSSLGEESNIDDSDDFPECHISNVKLETSIAGSVRRPSLGKKSNNDGSYDFIDRRYQKYFKKPVKLETPIAASINSSPLFESGGKPKNSPSPSVRSPSLGKKSNNDGSYDFIDRRYEKCLKKPVELETPIPASIHRSPLFESGGKPKNSPSPSVRSPSLGKKSNNDGSYDSIDRRYEKYLKKPVELETPIAASVHRSPLFESGGKPKNSPSPSVRSPSLGKKSNNDGSYDSIDRRYEKYLKKPVELETPIAASVHRSPLFESGGKPKNSPSPSVRSPSPGKNSNNDGSYDYIDRRYEIYFKKPVELETNQPKLPLSAYLIWLHCASVRAKIKQKNPKFNYIQIARKAGQMWRSLKDKSVWEAKAVYCRQLYEKACLQYAANLQLPSGSSKALNSERSSSDDE